MTPPAVSARASAPRWALDELPAAALLVAPGTASVGAANALAEELFAAAPGELAGAPLAELIPNLAELGLHSAEPVTVRAEGRRRDGVPFAAEVRLRRTGTRPDHVVCLVSRLGEAEIAAHAAAHLDAAFDHAPIGMALFNCDGEYIRVNAALCCMLGRSADDLIGRRDQELTHPDDREADVEVAWRILRGELHTHQTEKRFLRPDGSLVWTIANLSFLRDADGLPLAWLGQFQDISELRRTSDDLHQLATVDSLTGCLNRRPGLEALETEVRAARESVGALAVLMIDLDRFKQTNDRFGHMAGDDVLRATAEVVAACLAPGQTLSRYGGEEFMALLPGAGPAAAVEMAERVRRTITRLEVTAGDRRIPVSASIGVAGFDPATDTAQSLVARADTALYRAKAAGRNRVVAL
jgi:diguanylate cyclase (GGDEF)-like protein/PAS domain S-box-containing protein